MDMLSLRTANLLVGNDEGAAALEAAFLGPELAFEREQPFGAGANPSNIVDSAYPYGSIQIPGGLEPIVLYRDADSAGGYFQVGAVIAADMDLIGQMQPNLPTRFVRVDMDGALAARADRNAHLARIRDALS